LLAVVGIVGVPLGIATGRLGGDGSPTTSRSPTSAARRARGAAVASIALVLANALAGPAHVASRIDRPMR
jgi:hypothetical protein